MARVLVVLNDPVSPLGSFSEHFAADGISPTTFEPQSGAPIPDLDRFDILVVLGGRMEVWEEKEHPWLAAEKEAVRQWVAADKPLLGICLGHQLLADALGGQVKRAEPGEAALTEIKLTEAGISHPIFSGFGPSKKAISWHGSEVSKLPTGARLLASTADCHVTSFAVGSAAVGVQYHVEATTVQTNEWSCMADGAAHVERLHGAGSVEVVCGTIASAMPELSANSRRFYDNFMALARARLPR